MNVRIGNFHGIQPRVSPSLLGSGMAQTAFNCRLKSGKLVPLREPAVMRGRMVYMEGGLSSLKDARTLYPWRHRDGRLSFIVWPGIVRVAEGNIADDEYDRIFVAGETGVSWTDASGTGHENAPAVLLHHKNTNNLSRHALPKDTPSAPSVSVGQNTGAGEPFFVSVFAAYVDTYGYESPISSASNIIEVRDGADVSVDISGWTRTTEMKTLRLYVTRAGTDESADGIQFWRDVAFLADTTVYTATLQMAMLGEAAPDGESAPPDLEWIEHVPGGFYAGFSRSAPRTVMFSDIGPATSWPKAYRYDLKDDIVALATTSNTVFALTNGWPWVLTGTAPETMAVAKLAGPAACVSPRGVCVYRNSVYYASNEGLMAIVNDADAGTVCMNLTEKVFTKDQWQAFDPSSCLMGQFDGALRLFFRKEGGTVTGLTVDLNETADSVTTHDEVARCVCVDNATDTLYYVKDLSGMEA